MAKFTDTDEAKRPFSEAVVTSPQKASIDPDTYKEAEERTKKRAEEKKKKKKEEEERVKQAALLQKRPYTIKLEVRAPVEMTYRVWAESPEQALEMIRYGQMVAPPKPILSKRKNIKATVYKYGTTMIEFVKQYI